MLALFFAMRSCEYSTVPQSVDRRTKVITITDLQFFMNGLFLDHKSPELANADFVSVTFVEQKNGEKIETVTQFSTYDSVLCPVRAAASIVRRLQKLKSTTETTQINTYKNSDGKILKVQSKQVREALCAAVSTIGEDKLGFKSSEVGTHSIRSGAAMVMHLAEVPVYTIMIIGRWSSDAFLRYIRKQVAQFSQNISRRMISSQNHFHVRSFDQRCSILDPRQRNNMNNAQTHANMGGQPLLSSRLLAFALWT